MILVKKISILILFVFIVLYSIFRPKYDNHIIEGHAFGTTYSVNIYDKDFNQESLKMEIDSLINLINLDMSTYISHSNISVINKSEKGSYIISEHFRKVLGKALAYCTMSDFYDITILPLMNIWGFGPENEFIVPNQSTINKTLEFVNYNFLELSEGSLMKKDNKVQIDLNSLAKGYSVDLIGEFLSSKKLNNYLIEVGGEILAKGLNKKTQSIWTLGIQDPLNHDKYIETVRLSNKALATSGNYRKYRIDPKTGERYVHTINPITGLTSKNNTLSVSVVSKDCITSDAWATALLTLDLDRGRAIVDQTESLDALWIISVNEKVEIIKSKNWDKLTN
mgnify:CR=1 FL=1